MLDQAWKLYLEEDVFAVIEYLCGLTPTAEAVQTCADLVVKLYWEQKDLAAVIAVGTCGMTLGWKSAESGAAEPLLGTVKAIAYNLASFTWPGWDEPGIVVGKSELTIGLSAAKANLQLAGVLDKGPLAHARAQWVLGAHYMAQNEWALASDAFGSSAIFAEQEESPGEGWLAKGFAALAQLFGGNEAARARLAEAKEQLSGLKNGAGFVEQMETAERVFTG